jgi:heat-inducible transcriptional repressor
MGPGFGDEIIRGLHLVQLGGPVVMAVTVGITGRVGQEVVKLRFHPNDSELDQAERLLIEAFVGATLTEGVASISELPADQIADRVIKIARSFAAGATASVDATRELYVGGTSQLASLWQDLAQVHTMLELLEQHQNVRSLLDSESDATSVRLGSETEIGDVDFAVVSTAFNVGDTGRGRVGLLGPMRMDYRRAIRIVEEVGDGLEDSLGA